MSRRVALPLVTTGYLALVAWITLGSVSWHALGYEASYGVLTPSIWFDRSTWTTGSIFEFSANVAMFVPVGVLFAMIAGPRRWLGALVAALALTVAIELTQIPMADRISDPATCSPTPAAPSSASCSRGSAGSCGQPGER